MTKALNDLLQATSRSFYLTLRVLPARARKSASRIFPRLFSRQNRLAFSHDVSDHRLY
jgi:hypothetical protein